MRARRTLGAIVAALLAVQACDDGPVSPEADLSLDALGRDGGTVTVPMEVDATFRWIVPGATAADCPNLIDPSTGDLFTAEGFGKGEASHLGRFEVTKLDHPTINLCSILEQPPTPPEPSDVTRTGAFEFVAADGSTLTGSYEFFSPGPDAPGAFFTLIVEGGTGRLEGASGELEAIIEESGVPGPDDPADVLLLGTVTWEPAVLEGTLTLPRPGRGR